MNNSGTGFTPDWAVNSDQQQFLLAGHSDPPHQSIQQKRQSSISNYMKNSNKRTSNPLQMPMGMQSIQADFQYGGNTDHGHPNVTPTGVTSPRFNNNPVIRSNARRNIIQQHSQIQSQNPTLLNSMKTPTPSAYEVPSSPSINPMSNISVQNHSDSSDSNLLGEKQNISEPVQRIFQGDLSAASKDISMSTLSSNTDQTQRPARPDQSQNEFQKPQQRTMSTEEQQLAAKLKETYKNIVNYEEIVQKNCIDITVKINQITGNTSALNAMQYSNSQGHHLSSSVGSGSSLSSNTPKTSELSNELWAVYHHNATLLDNYSDFLITALKPSSNQTQFKTGKNIVDLYKIPRRMWVYGIVGFLEVLKNIMTLFQEHEICSCFIAYSFNIISNLTDPALEMEGWWSEKLGDLSRMAIALYATKFIDWKVSAEYWYSVAMKTLYGHGKIYYHMCTVQQDNLDALVNIGKSVVCHDPFVPTQHYLRLVVENICTQRNILSLLELPIIDFIKIHKVLLSIYNSNYNSGDPNLHSKIHDTQLQYGIDLVTRYGLTFGSDSNGYNFFTRELFTPSGVASISDPHHPYYLQQQQSSSINTVEKMMFWFNKGPLFAIANINHLIGFGDPKNPFAKLFRLPEALKERKDKKDRKRKSRTSSSQLDDNFNSATIANAVDGQTVTASDLSVNDWFFCLQYINKSVLELSIRIFNHYLIGPKQASTSHIIVWLYFLISVGEATKNFPNSKHMVLWLFRKLIPWESLINYLNTMLALTKNNEKLNKMVRSYLYKEGGYMQHFNEKEFLPEVWRCWGTLWFDYIATKTDYVDTESAGIQDGHLFDLPMCGASSSFSSNSDRNSKENLEEDNDERIVRIILLSILLADNYEFGFVRNAQGFKFSEHIYNNIDTLVGVTKYQSSEPQSYIEEFLFSDGRFIQNNFLQAIAIENLDNQSNQITVSTLNDQWFGTSIGESNSSDENIELGDDIIEEEELEGYADSEFDDEDSDFENQQENINHRLFHQGHHQHALQQARLMINDDPYETYIPIANLNNREANPHILIEGNLGDCMDTNITYISLDTNIWLKHCGRIFKCIRNKVFKILIPLIVFQELRSLRKSSESTISDAATRSVIIIRELYLNKEIIPIRFDGTVASDINETTEFENNSSWRSNVEETILNSVNEHDEISKKLMKGLNMKLSVTANFQQEPFVLDTKTSRIFRYCILITDDRNTRLRSKSMGLASFQSKWLFSQLEANFPRECID